MQSRPQSGFCASSDKSSEGSSRAACRLLLTTCQASSEVPSGSEVCDTPSVSLVISNFCVAKPVPAYTNTSSITGQAARTIDGWTGHSAATPPCFLWSAGSGNYRASAMHSGALNYPWGEIVSHDAVPSTERVPRI